MKFSFTDTELRPPPRKGMVFTNGIRHPDIFIWDAWSLVLENELFLYTLGTPREVFKSGGVDIQTERDLIPHHHRLFVSSDDGKSWRDEGPAFWPRVGVADAFDSRSIWTGSVTKYNGVLVGGYTGIRMLDDAHPFLQSIGLTISEDGGKTYRRLSNTALSCPMRDYEDIRKLGYYLGPREDLGTGEGEEGGSILAWRDPGLCVDAKTGALHAFWSAKSDTHTAQEAVLAHAIIHDPLGTPRAELLPPVRLPDAAAFTQAEVPQILYNKTLETYYLAVSTTNATTGQKDSDLDLNARLYASKDLNGPWEYMGRLITNSDGLYPVTLMALDETKNGARLKFIAPYNRSNNDDIMQTMPECMIAVIKDGKVESIERAGVSGKRASA